MLTATGPPKPYYQPFWPAYTTWAHAAHADSCAPGILRLLEPVRVRRGLCGGVWCGSGLLTRHLVDGAEEIDVLVLPDDPIPPADAVVSGGDVVNYLPDEAPWIGPW